MCGIAGAYGLGPVDPPLAAMRHRGPDGTGIWNQGGISLGINRLSIVGLHDPLPPIWNEDRTCCVVCNGEIYNYQQLRDELRQKGHHFSTESDTEVILHLYETYGEDLTQYLQGMFAFAVFDLKSQQFFLARDRFGEKPLFFWQKEDKFAFASEIGGLMAFHEITATINLDVLPQFLSCSWVKEPETLLKEIKSLPPGHSLTWCAGKCRISPFFQVRYSKSERFSTIDEAAAAFAPKFQAAVNRQMQADVPVGALLSGGLDSSAVVAAMAQASTRPIKTFHVCINTAERAVARTVARHFGTDHVEIALPQQGFDEAIFWKTIDHSGIPMADAATIPQLMISEEVRKHVKVVLSGDGGDEMLAGYDYYRGGMDIDFLRRLPVGFRRLAQKSLQNIRPLPGFNQSSILRKLIRALEGAELPLPSFFPWYFGLFTQTEISELSYLPVLEAPFLPVDQQTSALRQMMWFSTVYHLPLDLLVKTDRMSMACGLEMRAPFLDTDIFDFAAALPDALLTNRVKGKLVLRAMLKKQLPDAVLQHKKTGMIMPLHAFWNAGFRQMATALLTQPSPLDAVLNKQKVRQILQNGLSQTRDNAYSSVFRSTHQLWLLVQLYGWVHRWKVSV